MGGSTWKKKPHFGFSELDWCSQVNSNFGFCDSNSKPKQIQSLDFKANNLVGPFPSSADLAGLIYLKYLDMSNNYITGTVPAVFANFSSAEEINLSQNQLNGTIPPMHWATLSLLTLSQNHFTGPVPDFSESVLTSLDLSDNRLSGPLPARLGDNTTSLLSLTSMSFANNLLTGVVPDFYNDNGNLQRLTSLDLSNNAFSGPLPMGFALLSNMVTLKANGNSFTGGLPDFSEVALAMLNVSSNQITGSLPNLPVTLVVLDVSANHMSGTLPAKLGTLDQLNAFYAAHNSFTGPIPNLGALENLQIFDVSYNKLDGSVPAWADCPDETKLPLTCDAQGNALLICGGKCNNCKTCLQCGGVCNNAADCAYSTGNCVNCEAAEAGVKRCVAASASPRISPVPSPMALVTPAPVKSYTMFIYIGAGGGFVVIVVVIVLVLLWRSKRSDRLVDEQDESRPLNGTPTTDASDTETFVSAASRSRKHSRTRTLTVRGLEYPGSPSTRARRKEQAFTFVIDTKLEVIKWGDLEILGPIGKGGYGQVMKARRGHTLVAVKMFPNIKSVEQVQEFVEEATVLSDLKHPHCVLLMAVTVEPNHMCIVTEYMRGGDLHSLIYPDERPVPMPPSPGPLRSDMSVSTTALSVQAPLPLTWERRLSIIYDTAVGLEYLHSRGIPHRDIKLRNILLDDRSPQTVKLCDFGLSGFKMMDIAGGGTERYAAPEVLAGRTADMRSDVYSLGIVTHEVLFSRMPDKNAANPAPHGPDDLTLLLKACFQREPADRPTISMFLSAIEHIREAPPRQLGQTPSAMASSFGSLPFDSPSRARAFPAFDSPPKPEGLGVLPGSPERGPPVAYTGSDPGSTPTKTLGAVVVPPRVPSALMEDGTEGTDGTEEGPSMDESSEEVTRTLSLQKPPSGLEYLPPPPPLSIR